MSKTSIAFYSVTAALVGILVGLLFLVSRHTPKKSLNRYVVMMPALGVRTLLVDKVEEVGSCSVFSTNERPIVAICVERVIFFEGSVTPAPESLPTPTDSNQQAIN